MKIGVLGTGMAGRTISAKLVQLGQDVMVGTRDVDQTLARAEPDMMGNPPYREWQQQNPEARLGTFAEAAAFGEIVFNCTVGRGSLAALKKAGESNLNDKVLIDIANSLDFSQGMPPTLLVCNTDSLGEQIQHAFPQSKVVKTLNTVNSDLIVNPSRLSGGHDVFVSGNDPDAKAQVTDILKNWFGWKSVIDLGDITTARDVEMMAPICLNLSMQMGLCNFKIVA